MDPRLLRYYNQELQHLREMGAEFAQQFPKIAARLGMEGISVTDPYVERLLEGAGFLAARVQLKIDAEFPRFTQHLLEIIYPNYLAPTPSMLIAQVKPQLNETNLASGFTLPRGSSLFSQLGKGDNTPCEFRTASDLTLWPLEMVSADYFSFAPDLPIARLPVGRQVKGGVRIKLRTTAGVKFDQLDLDRLPLYFSGGNEIAYKLHEFCLATPLGMLVGPAEKPWRWHQYLPADCVRPQGYSDDEALLPVTARGFQGYRLMQEYFAFPQRFLFAELSGLKSAFKRHNADEIEIVLLFARGDSQLEGVVDKSNFSLFCVPAVNLFPKRADRIHINENNFEYHVVPDRTRPMDFEVHTITGLTGFGIGNEFEQKFYPLYADFHMEERRHQAYYAVRREPRLLSINQKKNGPRSSYVGSEVFISLVDPKEAPFPHDLRQLSITTLCTNRDLPLQMPLNLGQTDFILESAAPVDSIRCVKGPSKPYSPLSEGTVAWRLISHLSLNYLSLLSSSEQEGAAALREILELYAASTDVGIKTQVEGLRSIRVSPLTRRLPVKGPITFGRGLEIILEVDELAFQGGSAFLFGSMMEQFFARYVSINSFTETRLRTSTRGEVMRWVPRCGERAIL